MLIEPNFATMDDASLWHAVQGGADGAQAEMTRREARKRSTPGVIGAVHRIKAKK